jgi:flagellar hook protein FlgE
MSFSTALSALNANSTALSVTSDNLANLNTIGFKASRVTFSDLVSQFATEGLEVGAGVGRPFTQRQYLQGALETTGSNLDAALQGRGFFVVQDGAGTQLYTRAGNFTIDAQGRLMTVTGLTVQGWNAVNGTVTASGPVADIVLPGGGVLAPKPTSEISLTLNLDASQPAGAVFAAPVTITDSLGDTHVVTFTFTKTSITDWTYDITVPGEDLTSGTPGTPSSVGTGTISFGPDGLLTAPAAPGTIAVSIAGFANGAADAAVDWQLHRNGTESLLTHFAQPSALSSIDSDGTPAAELIDVAIVDGGLVVARFTEGIEEVIGQLGIALIKNPESLVSAGKNNFRLTSGSGTPAIGQAGSGGRGDVRGSTLESSTADVAKEFTNLIRYQRAYQANSRVVTTVDEVTQETLNLKR